MGATDDEHGRNGSAMGGRRMTTMAEGPDVLVATTSDVAAATSDDLVKVAANLPKPQYEELIKAAAALGFPPGEFVRWAIQEGLFIAEQRARGNRIFVQTRTGLRELVD